MSVRCHEPADDAPLPGVTLPTTRAKELNDCDYIWEMVMELQKLYPREGRPLEIEDHIRKLVKISRTLRSVKAFQVQLQGIRNSKHEVN